MAFPGFDLSGKIALVTGAGRGIGREAALGLAQAGADLAVTSRSEPELRSLAEEVRALGRLAEVFPADLRRVPEIREMVGRVEAHFGRIDILLNNAGTNVNQTVLEVTEEAWDVMMDTNLKGAFFCAQAVARGMVERQAGKIINMASTFAVVGMPVRVPYCATKGGVLQMTRAMAVELAAENVQINAVGPTATWTVMNQELFEQEAWRQMVLAKIPAGRFATPADVVGAVVYLASPAADMVTGQILLVDGGWTAQ
jgi:NAD(P)-dependent dehydrogenase (short-subunit alcohol dehydrogenase family)